MDDRNSSRSGLEKLADAARTAAAAARIARAAAVVGLKGAALEAAKEALPLLVKVAVGVLAVVLLIPMLIFTALPNIFFGFNSSKADPVIQMTQQAMTVGGAYMSLEDFENTQVDSFITGIVNEYERNGTTIDRIEVVSDFDEEDLQWLIAINSTAHQQDLNTMSAESIRDFCVSRLRYTPSLDTLNGKNGSTTTLKVHIEKLEPERLMDDLGFDEDAKVWAGALFETLSESDTLDQYGAYFIPYRPNYGGDTSYDGEIQHGGGYGNAIDISNFSDPDFKNNLDLAAYATQAWENNWGYVWGTYGNVLTESLLAYKIEQYPDGVGNHEDFIRDYWLGRRTTDCVGLIKGYGWLDTSDMTIRYATNGMPDYGANQMHQSAVNAGTAGEDYGSMDTMPELPGLAVWKDGHIGVYVGGGYVIEAMSTKRGVVKTAVAGRGWSGWCKIPYINYTEG